MGTTGQSVTLANSIIGVGILAMPFCFQQCGVILAGLILLFMGLVSRLCCYFLLKSALLARRRNFEFLAFHVFGSAGKLAVEVGIIGFLMGSCIAYFVVVGDLGPQIIAKMFKINQSDILRTSIMVIVSLVCVLPLGLLRNVDSLSNVSAATICFYFCLVMKVIVDAASQLATASWPTRVEMWRPAGLLQCVPILSMALFCQTQLFEIFESLPSLSLEKMNLVTKNAINICTSVYFTLGLFGYIAFSAQDISGNILMSLSPTMASDVIKLGFVMSVAFSFPLMIFPCRASLYSLLYRKVHSSHHDHVGATLMPTRAFRVITLGIVAAALGVGLLLPNIELVLGLLGASVGVLVCVVFPAACFVRLTFKNTNERLLAKGIVVLGLIIMVLGTYANLQAAESQMDKYDEKYITKERIDKMVEDFFQKMDKADNVVAKPAINNDKHDDIDHIEKDVIKESMALPPYPVPPESQSNEKVINNEEEIKAIPKFKEVLPEPEKDILDKVSETHPKNLNRLNDVKIANGDNKGEIVEKPKEEVKPQSNEEKINMMKKQQLIETIKQHGEEQKELMKEQKEILTEIKKTKEELQKSKSEAAEADAKKIAVESIKKIANVAIQSLASVSDKPGKMAEDKVEKLEKLADEAVQEIAQKAVETIEAIKEIQEKPENPAPVVNPAPPALQNVLNPVQNNIQFNQNVQQNVQQAVPQNAVPNPQNYQNVNNNPQGLQNNMNPQPSVDIQPAPNVPANIVQSPPNVAQPNSNVAQPNSNVAQQAQNVPPVLAVAQPIQNVAQQAPNIPPAPAVAPPNQNAAQQAPNIPPAPAAAQPIQNVAQQAPNVVQQNAAPAVNYANPGQPSGNSQPINAAQSANNAQPANIQPINQNIQPVNQNIQPVNQNIQNPPSNNVAYQPQSVQSANSNVPVHSHSPDEPQSYKQGEDVQKQVNQAPNNVVAQNVPLPLAINGNKKQAALNNNIVQNGQNVDNNPVRQKREVVDCTAKSTLKPEDKQICKTLVDNPGVNQEVKDILASKVDLSEVALPKNIAMQQNVLHHISRGLKVYDDNKGER